MALFEQVGNYVKVRTTHLPETANQEDYDRIHISEFACRTMGDNILAFMDGERTVLVISGDTGADAYYNDTMANLIDDVDTFLTGLAETGGPSGSSSTTAVSKSTGDFSGNNVTVAQVSGKTPDVNFWVFSGGLLLKNVTDYSLSGTTITVATGPTDLRILIFS